MTRGSIVCVGNWIVDTVHTIDHWPNKSDLVRISAEAVGVGGGAANVAMDLSAFQAGLTVFGAGMVGTDRHATTVRNACKAAGVDTRWLAETGAVPTAHTLVMNVPGDSRTFFYNPGASDILTEFDIPVAAMAQAGVSLFYLGYVNLLGALDAVDTMGGTGTARLLQLAKAAGMITCVDLVSAETPDFQRTVAAALPFVDHLFLNEVEAERATGIAVQGPQDRAGLLAAATALRQGGAGNVIIHTPALALWLGENAVWAEPEPVDPAQVISPVGAGDAFCAGAIYGIHQGWSVDRSLLLAHRAAAAALRGATATDGIPPLTTLIA